MLSIVPRRVPKYRRSTTGSPAIESRSGPLLGAVQNANNEDDVVAHLIDNQIGQRRKDQLTSASFLARPPAVRELKQGRRRIIDFPHKVGGSLRNVRGEVVCDLVQIVGSVASPAKLHSAAGLRCSQVPLETSTHVLMGQYLATLNLRESLLDLSNEPVVVIDGALDGL